MTTTFKEALNTSAAFTITLASLASDTNLLAGRQSTAISNASNLFKDYFVGGKITTGTSPTGGKSIEVWCYAAVNDTPLYPDAMTGTDGDVSATARYILAASARLVASMTTCNANNVAHWFGPVSLASLFGGYIPPAFGLFVVHNSGVNLNATGSNHALYLTGVYETGA